MKPHLKQATGFGAFNPLITIIITGIQVSMMNGHHNVNGFGLPNADPPAKFLLQQMSTFVQRGLIPTRNKDACGHSLRHAQHITHIIDLFTKFGASQARFHITVILHAKVFGVTQVQRGMRADSIVSLERRKALTKVTEARKSCRGAI